MPFIDMHEWPTSHAMTPRNLLVLKATIVQAIQYRDELWSAITAVSIKSVYIQRSLIETIARAYVTANELVRYEQATGSI